VRTSIDHIRIRIAAVATLAFALVAVVLGCGSSGGNAATAQPTTSARATNPAPVHGTYSPTIEPANFVSRVDNPYLPFKPGTTLRFKGVAENGTTPQTDVEFVTHRTKRILGVDATVVLDKVSSRGAPIERTYDWYAQDRHGNVWYFGEDASEFKHGRYVKASDSWEAGVDGAQPGIVMEAHPKRGDAYRQEYYPGHALDKGKVLGTAGPVKVPYRTFEKTLATVETSGLEPGAAEKKYYAAGIGNVLERVVKGNHERFALVSVSH
jgi:hypothetical protein